MNESTTPTLVRPWNGQQYVHIADLPPFVLNGRALTLTARCGRRIIRATNIRLDSLPTCPKCEGTR
jgi:hypothetical protein